MPLLRLRDMLLNNNNNTICKNQDEWQKARKLSATRASAILGQNPYMTNVDVWEILTNKKVDKDLSDNEAVVFGLTTENAIRELYQAETKDKYLIVAPDDFIDKGQRIVYHHKEKEYLTSSCDGLITELDSEKHGVLEIKTTSILSSIHRETWRDGIPQNYYIQLLHEMLVLDVDFGVLVAYLRYSDYSLIKAYRAERVAVENEIKSLFEKEVEFWEKYVATNKKPPLLINI